jgi:dienelactone hydrolase
VNTLSALLLVAAAMTSSAHGQGQAGHFDYDFGAPLDIQESGVEHRGGVAIHDISYASPKGGRVPAYLVVPEGRGPFAAVIWGHWYWSNSALRNRKEFLDEAVALAPSGVVSLLTDGPIARPGHVADKNPLSQAPVADLIQQVVDSRRGADLLLARSDVDRHRLAYVGHSYNAAVGGILSGADKRFKAFVLMAGNLSDEQDDRSKEGEEFRQQIGPEAFDAFVAQYGWLDPGKFISRATGTTFLLQYGSQEEFFSQSRVSGYASLIKVQKEVKFYDAPHALNAQARHDRLVFLAKHLKVRAPTEAVMRDIPDLFQPADQDSRGLDGARFASSPSVNRSEAARPGTEGKTRS